LQSAWRALLDALIPGGRTATNTIGQGDTRASGLTTILSRGGAILRATRRLKWPGEAAVVVSIVHVVKGEAPSPVLDGQQVRRISAYLVEGDLDTSPASLPANARKAFQGSILLGMGFTFDDVAAAKGEAENLATMRALIAKNPENAERIFPYIGGEEVNTDPCHAHHRYVIDFDDFPLRREAMAKSWAAMTERECAEALRNGIVPSDYPGPVAADWPDLLSITEARVGCKSWSYLRCGRSSIGHGKRDRPRLPLRVLGRSRSCWGRGRCGSNRTVCSAACPPTLRKRTGPRLHAAELDSVINWRFSLENLLAANDRTCVPLPRPRL
jgi:hypothetical protein